MISHIFFEDGTKVEISSKIKGILNSLVYVLVCRNLWIRHEFSNLIVSNSIFVCKRFSAIKLTYFILTQSAV